MKRLFSTIAIVSMLLASVSQAYAAQSTGELTVTVVASGTNSMFYVSEASEYVAFVPANQSRTYNMLVGAHDLTVSAPIGYQITNVTCNMLVASESKFSLTVIISEQDSVNCTIYANQTQENKIFLPIIKE